VAVCRSHTTLAASAAGLLLAVQLRWAAGVQLLPPGERVWWDGTSGPATVSCGNGAAALLAVSVHPVER